MKNILRVVSIVISVAVSAFGQGETVPVKVGQSVTMWVTADGYPTPTLQWYKDGVGILGATGNTFVIPKAKLSDAGAYTVVATNEVGMAVSAPEILNVIIPRPKAADDSYEVIDPSPMTFWKALRKDFVLASLPRCLRISPSKGGRA